MKFKISNRLQIITFGLCLTILSVCLGIFFFNRRSIPQSYGQPPALLSNPDFATISKVSSPIPASEVLSLPCETLDSTIIESLSDLTHAKPEGNKEPDYTRSCEEYFVNENLKVLDLRLYGQKNLVAKYHPEGVVNKDAMNWKFQKIVTQMLDYPAWSYEIKSITNDGLIFIEYGGWEYLGWEKSGTHNFAIQVL